MTTGLEDKVVIVTGAGRGIGLSIAQTLTARGATVVAASRTLTPEMQQAATTTFALDLATPDGPATLIERALVEHRRLDVLVNNVGTFAARTGGFANITDDDWETTLQVNLLSAVRAIRAALPSLVDQRGAIINVSSARAREPQPPIADYAAAKAALTNLGVSLAQELGPRGVQVSTVSPGPTRTPAWEVDGGFGSALAQAAGVDHQTFLEGLPEAAGIATGRLTEPDEVAELVALLASGRVRNVHGADLVVDGGLTKGV